MNGGIQKWALIAYIAMCVFFLAQPSANKLIARAHALDSRLRDQSKAELKPVLAAVLEIPIESVESLLDHPEFKPSELIFSKLLEKCSSHIGEGLPAEQIIKSGMDVNDAIAYFDQVEVQVTQTLAMINPDARETERAAAGKPSASPSAFKEIVGLFRH